MAFGSVWAIQGEQSQASEARGALFDSTKGETSITGPAALRVEGLAGGQVGIGPGSGVIGVESRRESYRFSNSAMDGNAVIEVPVAGSSGATWFVGVQVIDPQYEGQEGAVLPRLASSRAGLGSVALPLARINLEAGETVGPTSEIVDMRQVANPRRWNRQWVHRVSSAEVDVLTGEQTWPDAFIPTVDVPPWAAEAIIAADYGQVLMPAGGFDGTVFVGLGNADQVRTLDVRFEGGDTTQRITVPAGGTVSIPASMRGTNQPVRMRGSRLAGNEAASPRFRSGSVARLEVTFLEQAD